MSEHTHDHHGETHDHDRGAGAHSHSPRTGILGLLMDAFAHLFGLHQHAHTRTFESVLESSACGIWALKVSLLALFADTIYNFSDDLFH